MPATSAAPSISPGMSATTNSRWWWRTTPSCGRVVVKAYSPTFAWALVTWLMKVDLPALGSPTSPASASNLRRNPPPRLLLGRAGAVLTWGAVGRGLVAGIAAPAVAAPQEHHALADLGEV